MTREEKIEFVTSLCNSLRDGILAKVDRMPEEWDGHELRQYVKDQAATVVWRGVQMSVSRKRKYNNTVMVKCL